MVETIREIEKIIDNYHSNHSALKYSRGTCLLYALRLFEDNCRLGGTAEINLGSDSLDHLFLIREQLNSLRTMILWIYNECKHSENDEINLEINEKICYEFIDLLFNHARPYSILCSAYIGYSRNRSTATYIEGTKTVKFETNQESARLFISDISETISFPNSLKMTPEISRNIDLQKSRLYASIRNKEGHVAYNIDTDIWNAFKFYAQYQWDTYSELPLSWEFQDFTLNGFREFWITIYTYCTIHSFACLNSEIMGAAADDAVILNSKEEFINCFHTFSDISRSEYEKIFNYLIYDNNIKNNDPILQPFIPIRTDFFALAPHLVLASSPERNLITLFHKKKDRQYFDLTNQREKLMIREINDIIVPTRNLKVINNKKLKKSLPDLDYAIYDISNHTVLICELKWLIEADSVQEVDARELDLYHGCQQIQTLCEYAEDNPHEFMMAVFGEEKHANYSFIPCVISKKGIRVKSNPVSVVSLSSFLECYKESPTLQGFFRMIKNREFLKTIPECFSTYDKEIIEYAGYSFELPALIKIKKRVSDAMKRTKVGRNQPCPCGSGRKYKKCCGCAK